MKKIVLLMGIVLLLFVIPKGIRYFFDYNTLTQYGKGYVWGSIFLLIIGLVLIFLGLKKEQTGS